MHYELIAEGLESKINKFVNECCNIKKTSGDGNIIFRTENVIITFNQVEVGFDNDVNGYKYYIKLFLKMSNDISRYLCRVIIPINELDNLIFDSTYARINFIKG